MDFLTGLEAADLANQSTMLGLVILLIIIGGLVPRWVHSQMMKLKDDTIENLREQNGLQARQIDQLIETSELAIRVAEDRRDPDDPEPGSPTEGASR
ncbi:hypothetical protein GS982_01235 [Rhodococcus hoagii]|uniref:Uncharacterized protein n=1 Tax=Rhodococcus hoagii TaxID=43767 RepID=A0A9Q4ZIJ8_RHOHA|nr:hypothetical protein [Prescottella equi]NKT77231.1 hypothetical protein [Prescottella equi]NKZ81015.1 hypothetical protein [Prescottella equi]